MTHSFVDIADIKNGVVILKNRALRAVLEVSSINFELKSQDEQKAIIYAFQNFLNSLDFPIQIVVQSRKLDIKQYLSELEELKADQDNELLNIQTTEYIEFIRGLVDMANIMTKNFYISIPFSSFEAKRDTFLQKMKTALKPPKKVKFTEKAFSRYREQLWQRVEHVAGGLSGMSLKVSPLSTEELLELFYKLYNP